MIILSGPEIPNAHAETLNSEGDKGLTEMAVIKYFKVVAKIRERAPKP